MTNRYPWKENTSQNTADQDDPRYETPGGAANKIEQSLQDSKEYTDARLSLPELPIQNGAIVERHIRSENISSRTIAQKAVTLPKVSDEVLNAANHKYSGRVNASNVTGAINVLDDRVQYFIDNSGTSVAELIDARLPSTGIAFPNLRSRLNDSDNKLAAYSSQISAIQISKADKVEVNQLSALKADKSALELEISDRKTAISVEKTERMNEINVERNRIDSLASLSPGSTTGDAELIDTRLGYDGSKYTTAGNSVRFQSGKIAKTASDQGNDLSDINGKVYTTWQLGGVVTNGTPTTGVLTDTRIHSEMIPVSVSKDITVSVTSGAKYNVHLYGSAGYLGALSDYKTTTTTRVVSTSYPSAIYAVVVMGYTDDRVINPGNVAALSAMLTIVRSDVSRIENVELKFGSYFAKEITMVDGFNVNLGVGIGNTVSLNPETVPSYRYAIVSCQEGDLFTVNGIGGSNPRLWGFVDSDNKLLSVANVSINISDNLVLVAPKNASKLILNDAKSGRKSYSGADLTKSTRIDRNRVTALEEKSTKTDDYLYGKAITMIDGYNITLAVGMGNVVNMTPIAVSVYRYAVVNCVENDMFSISGTGGENPRLWGFVDSNNVLLSVADSVKTEQNLLLVAPKNASKLIINDLKTGKISYNGVNLSKTLGSVINKMSENDFETRIKKLDTGLDKLGTEIEVVREAISKTVSAKELSIGTGSPTQNTYTYGIARVPYWSMSGEVTGQSLTAYINSFGNDWDGIEVSVVVMNPSGTPLETDFDVFQARINPIIYGEDIDSSTFLTDPVVHKASKQGIVDKVVLARFAQVDTSNPFMILVYRKNDHEKDTNVNPVGIVSVEIRPVKLQSIEIQQADRYNAWPFISSVGNKLVTVYSKGLGHEDNVTPDIYRKISIDGGKNWSSEKMIVNTVGVRDTVTGKGKDSEGNMLIWVRKGAPSDTAIHELYKTTDGETFTSISTPVFTVKASHIGDIFSVPTVGLMAFYNSEITNSWGVIKSSDNGVTWTQQPIETSITKLDCPTEISGAYIGGGKIIAIGRKNHYVAGQPYVQFQMESSDYGMTWTKANTNIGDISLSTPSLVYDSVSDILSLYYFERGAGKLKLRQVRASDIWGNPLNWPASRIVAFGSTNAQDTGNVNAIALDEKHIAVYYSGDATNTSIYAVIVYP